MKHDHPVVAAARRWILNDPRYPGQLLVFRVICFECLTQYDVFGASSAARMTLFPMTVEPP